MVCLQNMTPRLSSLLMKDSDLTRIFFSHQDMFYHWIRFPVICPNKTELLDTNIISNVTSAPPVQ